MNTELKVFIINSSLFCKCSTLWNRPTAKKVNANVTIHNAPIPIFLLAIVLWKNFIKTVKISRSDTDRWPSQTSCRSDDWKLMKGITLSSERLSYLLILSVADPGLSVQGASTLYHKRSIVQPNLYRSLIFLFSHHRLKINYAARGATNELTWRTCNKYIPYAFLYQWKCLTSHAMHWKTVDPV